MLYPVELRALQQQCLAPGQFHSSQRRTGRGRGIRTPDILLPKQARYQTALYPDIVNSANLYLTLRQAGECYGWQRSESMPQAIYRRDNCQFR